jgi:ribosome recycling factor
VAQAPKPDIADIKRRMDGALDSFKKELAGLRTGRASANLLDPVTVEVYGAKMPLNQVASVSAPEPRLITVTVWDKGNVKATEKAIREAGLGLNPTADGTTIRVPLPELNQDRRKELSKVAHKYAEAAKVVVRNVRRDGMEACKKAEKDKTITEDEHKRLGDQIQTATDDHVKKIDDALAAKDKEIMQV